MLLLRVEIQTRAKLLWCLGAKLGVGFALRRLGSHERAYRQSHMA